MRIVSYDCPSCGAKLNSDLDRKKVFCEYCGREIVFDDEFQRVVLDAQNVKDLANEINRGMQDVQNNGADSELIASVRDIRNSLSEYQMLQATIFQKKSKLDEQMSLRKKVGSPLTKIIPWLLAVLLVFILVQMVRYSTIFILLRLLVFLFGLFMAFVTCRVVNFALNNSAIELDAKVEQLNEELDRDNQQLSKLIDAARFSLIPEKYLNADAVDYIYEILSNKRATTIQQAVNLYEDKLHQEKLEEMRREELRLQQEQLDHLKEIKEQNEENQTKSKVGLGDMVKIGGAVAIGGAIAKKIKDDLL